MGWSALWRIGDMDMKKEKFVAAVCAILIGCCCPLDGIAEVIYAGETSWRLFHETAIEEDINHRIDSYSIYWCTQLFPQIFDKKHL